LGSSDAGSEQMDPDLERAFFEDVARAEDMALEILQRGISGEPGIAGEAHAGNFERVAGAMRGSGSGDALERVVREIVHAVTHSVIVTLDGGSLSAEHPAGPVRLVDRKGGEARPGLHEWYVDHLFETGRRQ
jgi:hypothetical protein